MDRQNRNFGYKSHLDGIRAISVFGVLVFHLRPDWLPGGFLGVDIFFLISGFLITSLLFHEIQQHGRIDFRRFYRRRFKRLFPSFILVILITLIASYFLLDDLKFVLVAKTALFSLLGVSNIYFYQTSNYFDLSSIEKPLLHIWSLNVEEQFYLVWPILLCLTYKLLRNRAKQFYALVVILFITSIGFNLIDPVATFYLPFFRLYEFLIGAALALFPLKKGHKEKGNKVLLFLSLFATCFAFLVLNSSSLLPGPKTILFIIPAIFLITLGGIKSKVNILNVYFFKYIGKRSYTIYLVHWPIIVLYLENKSKQKLTTVETFSLALTIFIVADLIYRYFEKPMRESEDRSKTFLMFVLASSIAVVSFSATSQILNKKPFSNAKNLVFTQSAIEAGKQMRFNTRVKICETKGWENCDNPQSSKFRGLILGDSHAIDALNAMYSVFPEIDYSMSQLGGCPPTKRMRELVPQTFPDLEQCIKLNQTRYDLNYLNSFDVIVINVLFGWYPLAELQSYLAFLHQSGFQKVIVFGDFFETKTEVPEIINRFGFDESKLLAEIIPKIDSDSPLQTQADKLDYFFVSKRESFCPKSVCTYWNSGIPYTWDKHHLSFQFARRMLESYEKELKEYLFN